MSARGCHDGLKKVARQFSAAGGCAAAYAVGSGHAVSAGPAISGVGYAVVAGHHGRGDEGAGLFPGRAPGHAVSTGHGARVLGVEMLA